MKVRMFEEGDHKQLTRWWSAWGWPPLPLEALPKNGLIISNFKGESVCMGFLYLTDSSISWLEWITANPGIKGKERAEGIAHLIYELKDLSKACGRNLVFSSMDANKTPGLIKKMQEMKFKIDSEGMTNLMAVL